MSAFVEYQEVQAGGSVQHKQAPFPTGVSVAQPTTPFGNYITVTDEGFGPLHITKLVLAGLPVTLANTTGISFGSKQLLTFPLGSIHVLSTSVEDFIWGLENAGNATPIAGTMGGDISLGSTATADATLNSTDVDMLASTSYDPFSTAISARQAINAMFNGTSTAVAAYLNAIIDDADVADAASDILEANGTIRIAWMNLRG